MVVLASLALAAPLPWVRVLDTPAADLQTRWGVGAYGQTWDWEGPAASAPSFPQILGFRADKPVAGWDIRTNMAWGKTDPIGTEGFSRAQVEYRGIRMRRLTLEAEGPSGKRKEFEERLREITGIDFPSPDNGSSKTKIRTASSVWECYAQTSSWKGQPDSLTVSFYRGDPTPTAAKEREASCTVMLGREGPPVGVVYYGLTPARRLRDVLAQIDLKADSKLRVPRRDRAPLPSYPGWGFAWRVGTKEAYFEAFRSIADYYSGRPGGCGTWELEGEDQVPEETAP